MDSATWAGEWWRSCDRVIDANLCNQYCPVVVVVVVMVLMVAVVVVAVVVLCD